jgi:hypothetical protein
MNPKGNQNTKRLRTRLAVGFPATHSRTWHLSIRRGDHSILMGWDCPIDGSVLVEERRIDEDRGNGQEALRE